MIYIYLYIYIFVRNICLHLYIGQCTKTRENMFTAKRKPTRRFNSIPWCSSFRRLDPIRGERCGGAAVSKRNVVAGSASLIKSSR